MKRVLMKRVFLIVSLLLHFFTPLSLAEIPFKDIKLEQYLSSLEKSQARVGLLTYSLGQDKAIINYHADDSFIPASLTKIIVSALSLSELGADYRFRTKVFKDGVIEKETLYGNLVIVGSGDPTLNPLSLQRLAEQIRHFGIRHVQGDLFFDDGLFQTVSQRGWPRDVRSEAYLAPSNALSLNYNTVLVEVSTRPDGTSNICFEPPGSIARVINNIGTGGIPSFQWTSNGWLVVSGRVGNNKEYKRRISVAAPSYYTATVLRNQLELDGIRITGEIKRGSASPHAVTIAEWSSDPLQEILVEMNKYSNNFIAEQLRSTLEARKKMSLQEIAKALWDNKKSSDVESFLLEDGAGLSRGNRMSPRFMGTFMVNAMKNRREGRYFFKTLTPLNNSPIYAEWGVHVRDGSAIRIKSGHLPNYYNMAGFVGNPEDGLLFVFMMERSGILQPTIKQISEDVLNHLLRLGESLKG